MNPFMLAFLYQNQIGDFDNMQLGLFTGVTIPGITHLYASLFMDELNVESVVINGNVCTVNFTSNTTIQNAICRIYIK